MKGNFNNKREIDNDKVKAISTLYNRFVNK